MRYRFPLLALSLASLLMFGGCKKDDNPVEPLETPTVDLLPLQVGARWSYRLVLFNEDGSISDSLSFGLPTVNEKDTVVSGTHWTLTNTGEAYSKQSDGIHTMAVNRFWARAVWAV